MCLCWGGRWFIDTSPAFGIRLGAHYCCRAMNAVCHLAARDGAPLFAYIDDFIGWAPGRELAWSAFRRGRHLLRSLGLQESPDKATEPSTTVTWVGVRFDSDEMTMSIPEDKIRAMVGEITVWLQETTIQLRELQKLLGRLFHATKCSVGARLFCNRLLDGLRTAYRQGFTPINVEMRQDLFWMVTFLTHFNGIHLIREPDVRHDITVDACLSGGGGAWRGGMFRVRFLPSILQCGWHISQLEAFTLLLAVRWWQQDLRHSNITIWCDNSSTVTVIQSGRAVDPMMRACARETWLLATLNDIDLTVRHVRGTDNTAADTLSRAHLSEHARAALVSLEEKTGHAAVVLPDTVLGPPTSI